MKNQHLPIEIAGIILRFILKEITREEEIILNSWINEKPGNILLFNKITNEKSIQDKNSLYKCFNKESSWMKIINNLTVENNKKTIQSRNILKYAAIILFPLLIASIIVYQLYINKRILISDNQLEILPGSHKAVLIFEDGEKVNLGNSNKTKIISLKNLKIMNKSNTLFYTESNETHSNTTIFNTLQTPAGGEYSLFLSDGTKIILNAASELKYPVQFNTSSRKIFLKGEAYFDVAKNKDKPFIVSTNDLNITVLGTSFNVMAYPDENNIETTLLSGKVKIQTKKQNNIEKAVNLNPGSQAVYNRGNTLISIKPVDTELYTAWINGKFVFENDSLDQIMRTLERWYNFNTEYSNEKIKNYHFSGTLERYDNILNILEIIEMTTKIKFEIKENKIFIKEGE